MERSKVCHRGRAHITSISEVIVCLGCYGCAWYDLWEDENGNEKR